MGSRSVARQLALRNTAVAEGNVGLAVRLEVYTNVSFRISPAHTTVDCMSDGPYMHWCAHVTALLRGKNKRGSQREKRRGRKGKKKEER